MTIAVAVGAVVFDSRVHGQDEPGDVGLRRTLGQHREAHGHVRARTVQNIRRDHRQRGRQQAARLKHVQAQGGSVGRCRLCHGVIVFCCSRRWGAIIAGNNR